MGDPSCVAFSKARDALAAALDGAAWAEDRAVEEALKV